MKTTKKPARCAEKDCPSPALPGAFACAKHGGTLRIEYVTGVDGWGTDEPPTADERSSWCELVERRLRERFPNAEVTADVDADVLSSRVRVEGPGSDDVDAEGLRAWIGGDLWAEWCSGNLATEPPSASSAILAGHQAVFEAAAKPEKPWAPPAEVPLQGIVQQTDVPRTPRHPDAVHPAEEEIWGLRARLYAIEAGALRERAAKCPDAQVGSVLLQLAEELDLAASRWAPPGSILRSFAKGG